MNRAKLIISSIVEENPSMQPPAIQSTQPASISQDFLAYIKGVENPAKEGRKGGRWYPIPDPSYGQIVGYGHQLVGDELNRAKQGLTDTEVEGLLVQDITQAKNKVHRYIRTKYGATIQLNPQQEQMLIDYAFNLGGLEKFPKMTDAVLRWNMDVMRQEYKRFATIGGKKQELSQRNAAFARKFLGL